MPLLANNNIPLQGHKNQVGALAGSRKNEEGLGKSGEIKKKKHVSLVCTSLFLNNNEIRSIKGLNDTLKFVIWQPQNLEWLDLSYNYLQNIEKEIL